MFHSVHFFLFVRVAQWACRAKPRSGPEPRQPFSQAQTRTNNITWRAGTAKAIRIEISRENFFREEKFFQIFHFSKPNGPIFLFDFCRIFVFSRKFCPIFSFLISIWFSISLELFVFIRTIFVQKFMKKSQKMFKFSFLISIWGDFFRIVRANTNNFCSKIRKK